MWNIFCGLVCVLASFSAQAACTDVDGWNAGRAGVARADGCSAAEYVEAHRLGDALHELEVEQRAIDTKLAAHDGDAGVRQRRLRQLENDVEAIRGIATIKGWPLDPVQGDKK